MPTPYDHQDIRISTGRDGPRTFNVHFDTLAAYDRFPAEVLMDGDDPGPWRHQVNLLDADGGVIAQAWWKSIPTGSKAESVAAARDPAGTGRPSQNSPGPSFGRYDYNADGNRLTVEFGEAAQEPYAWVRDASSTTETNGHRTDRWKLIRDKESRVRGRPRHQRLGALRCPPPTTTKTSSFRPGA